MEKISASASMVFAGNINQSVDVLLKTSSLSDPFPPEMHWKSTSALAGI